MLTDMRQNELDLAEERVLTNLFGSTTPDAKTQWLLKFLDIDINDIIQNFESIMKPIMNDNGLVNAELAKSLTATKFPLLSNILPTSNFRLVDAADGVINILQSLIRGR